jgi:hypothetical protein
MIESINKDIEKHMQIINAIIKEINERKYLEACIKTKVVAVDILESPTKHANTSNVEITTCT